MNTTVGGFEPAILKSRNSTPPPVQLEHLTFSPDIVQYVVEVGFVGLTCGDIAVA